MKKIIRILLLMLMIVGMIGCGNSTQNEISSECNRFMKDIQSNDWESVQKQLFVLETNRMPKGNDGIFQAMLKRFEYEIETIVEIDSNVYEVTLMIHNIDIKQLLDSLSEDVSSKEEARLAMIKQIEQMELISYKSSIQCIKVDDHYEIMMGDNFVNAILGGFHSFIVEQIQEVNMNEE